MEAYLFVVFVVGACIGSFVNVLLARLPTGQAGLGRRGGIFLGRSECPHCRRTLAWYDLVPLLSFFFLGGRCRACRKPISARYPLVELSTALVLVWFFARAGMTLSPDAILSAVLVVGLLALFFFDSSYLLLPDALVVPLAALALVQRWFFGVGGIGDALWTGFLLAAAFGILYVVSGGRWLGMGDVKFAFLIGVLFGSPLGVAVVVGSIWVATLFGLVLMALRRATLATALPFGAFLAGVAIVTLVFKDEAQILIGRLFW